MDREHRSESNIYGYKTNRLCKYPSASNYSTTKTRMNKTAVGSVFFGYTASVSLLCRKVCQSL